MGMAGLQLSMFDSAPEHLCRRTDPVTSFKAAVRVCEFSGNHRDIILACLKRYGPATVDEISKRTELTAYQVSKRMKEIGESGAAAPTGKERMSASGRPEREWVAI